MSINVSKRQYFLDHDILKLYCAIIYLRSSKISLRSSNEDAISLEQSEQPRDLEMVNDNIRIDVKNLRFHDLKLVTKSILTGCFFLIFFFFFFSLFPVS